ncbi:hypothetical protein PV325_009718 [Microctonus aethiopoides]|uniref:Dynein regulatory complex protein 10 n=1 Tax=Microctonus aethiopoides TaxID=144406 RepID=A0AA39FYL2_9HYME|nr:hypothetical protein PV325_009718 [Microctonus aethiopoides]KAK0178128.1 hypothetical protein PV328_002106 [Microctonus aethiopoides]
MECQVAISRICAILNELLIKIKKLIEDNDELLNNIEDKSKTECDAVWNFINMLNHLNYLVEIRLRTSSTVERERASNLASALVNEKKAQVETETLINEIESARMKHEYHLNDLKAQIAEMKSSLELIEKNQERKIAEIINESSRNMTKIMEETMEKEEKLKNEINLKNVEFENIYGINLSNERELYILRKKTEHEYLEILGIYDNNVGGLYRIMESLIEKSNLLDTNLKICQEKLEIQETEYKILKNEKESEILKTFTENLNKFKRNRAAKIIQIAWRKYLERLLLRKKKKSKKKKTN